MTIYISFFKDGLSDEHKNKSNKKLTEKIIDAFQEETSLLKSTTISFYFGMKGEFTHKSLGTVFKKGKRDYTSFLKHYHYETNHIEGLEKSKYLVYICSDIRDSTEPIRKAFTIAHELQHIIQDIRLASYDLYRHRILHRFFSMKKFNRNFLPNEIDAIQKSKIICLRIFKFQDLFDFLEQEIAKLELMISNPNNSSVKMDLLSEQHYWKYIQRLRTDIHITINEFWDVIKNKGHVGKLLRKLY